MYGHAKQGACYGHTKIAGKQILRKGLSPLVTTISTDHSAPVIAGARLRAGKANSGKGAASMITEAVATARAAGVTGQILVRGDSAYGTGTVVNAAREAGARFSVAVRRQYTDQFHDVATVPGRSDVPDVDGGNRCLGHIPASRGRDDMCRGISEVPCRAATPADTARQPHWE